VKDALIVVNPAAGGGRAGAAWSLVEPLAHRLAEVDVTAPAGAPATRDAVALALDRGYRRIVAFGGDGTAHLVASTLLAAGAGQQVTFGVVAAGTGSDLARALAVPRDVLPALARALLGPPAPMDAGHCEGESGAFHFINIASAGIGGLVDEMVNALPRRGTTAFLRATLSALRRYRCVPVRIALDENAWYEGPILLAAVANGTCFGKGMRAAPQARTDDGLFDVVVAGEIGGPDLPRRLLQLYLGRHLDAKPVRWARARVVRLEPLAPLPVLDADGETYPSGAATFTMLPAALRIAAPLPSK
jgi:diacylglycerol kinase (ATP)